MPKDYARSVDFTKEGQVDLETKLRRSGFRVEGKYHVMSIFDNSVRGNRPLGYIDPYNKVLLYILAIKDNPLEEFVRNYDSLTAKPKTPYSRIKR